MKHKNTLVKETKNHSPFGLRKAILFCGIVSGLVSGYLLKNYYIGLCVHLVVATLVDLIVHYGFHLKASSFVDPKQLLSHEEITPEALDRHYAAKCNIRLLSLVLASSSQVVLHAPELFLGVFATSTLLGRFYAWFQLDIVGPKVLHTRNLSPSETAEMYSDILERNREMNYGTATGYGSYGILKTS
ncbi:MAG: hypothetical protein NWR43_01065 [Alphaproteobacteria bacterium]|nr:hypothetical protein [Alphaproteobacteria bacterium]